MRNAAEVNKCQWVDVARNGLKAAAAKEKADAEKKAAIMAAKTQMNAAIMAANTDDMKQILENYSSDLLSLCWDDWAIAAAKSQRRPVLALLISEGRARQMPAAAMERLRADRAGIKRTQAHASQTIAAASVRTAALACASDVAAAKQQHVKRVPFVKLVSGVAANLSPTCTSCRT